MLPFLTKTNDRETSEASEMEKTRENVISSTDSTTEASSRLVSELQPQASSSNAENDITGGHSSSDSITSGVFTISLKGTMLQQDENLSYFSPPTILDIFGLSFRVTPSMKPEKMRANNVLHFAIDYGKLANLTNLNLEQLTKRTISELLGSVYESSPYILAYLKFPLKVALHLAFRIGTLLTEYKKLLISLILYASPSKNFRSKSKDGKDFLAELFHDQNYSNLTNILGNTPEEKVKFVQSHCPKFSWGTNHVGVRSEVEPCKFIHSDIR